MGRIDPPLERLRDGWRRHSPGRSDPPLYDCPGDLDVTLDTAYEILKNRRRRRTLVYLREQETPVDIGEIAEVLAARENDMTVAELTSTERKRTYVALYQTHLPKLDDMGVVEYDSRGGRVELTPKAETVLAFAEGVGNERPWYAYYGGLGAGTTALFTVNYLALLPVTVAANVFTGLVIVMLVFLSLIHRTLTR